MNDTEDCSLNDQSSPHKLEESVSPNADILD